MTTKTTAQRTVKLSDLARQVKVAPKTARSYARRHKREFPKPVGRSGWRFRVQDQTRVKRILVSGV
jgi:hypothetical protein